MTVGRPQFDGIWKKPQRPGTHRLNPVDAAPLPSPLQSDPSGMPRGEELIALAIATSPSIRSYLVESDLLDAGPSKF